MRPSRWILAVGSCMMSVAGVGASGAEPAEEEATLIRVAEGDDLTPVSIDPSGIAYLPDRNGMLISDSEIDEATLFQNTNLWLTTRSFGAVRTGLSPEPADRLEPNGLGYDPGGRRLFISNDQTDSVFIVGAGSDGHFGTPDDAVEEYSVEPFGIFDLGDVAYSSRDGSLFVVDHTTTRLYRIDPGPSRAFDGPPPGGDDSVTSFRLSDFGVSRTEGLGYRPSSDTLLVTQAGSQARIHEFTTLGHHLRSIDLSSLRRSGVPLRLSDVTVAPPTGGGGSSLYVTDRGADSGNPDDPTPGPQDGRLYEVKAPFANLAPQASAGPDQSLTLSQSATLRGQVIDDGQPTLDGLRVRWAKVDGPGDVTLGSPNGAETVASFSQTGTYVLRLTADDGALSASDTVRVSVSGSSSGRFTDDDESIFENDIEWLADQGIARGCNPPHNTLFCPLDPVTRGQMAAFLVRALEPPASPDDPFTDDNESVFERDIQALAAAGITRGCNPPDNDRYCPHDPVTRGQMAAFLVRALELVASPDDRFTDDNESVFERDIQALAAAGITRGCNPPANDRYCPHDPVTRGQMAAFLRRALSG